MEGKLASKKDLQELRIELQHSMSQLEAKLSLVESKLTIKMGTMLAASIAILTLLPKLT